MTRLEPGQVPRLRSQARYRVVGGQAVIIIQDSGEALVLNEVGSRILELADGKRRVEEIVTTMLAEFDVSAEELERDVGEHLGELVEAGVLDAPAKPDPGH